MGSGLCSLTGHYVAGEGTAVLLRKGSHTLAEAVARLRGTEEQKGLQASEEAR